MCLEGMDRSRRQRTALQIDPSTAAAREGPGAEDPMETKGRHLVIRLQPRSRREAVLGEREGAVLIAVQAPPVDGAANAALLRFLATRLRLPLKALTLVRGASGRMKWIGLDGLTVMEAREQLLEPQEPDPSAPA